MTLLLLLAASARASPAGVLPADTKLLPQGLPWEFLPGIQAPWSHGQQEDTVCLTHGCVKAAAELIRSMDETVDPCTDFYEFACGNYRRETTIPDHKSDYGTFADVAETLNERLRKVFESTSEGDEPEAYDNVRNLYKSCMDEEEVERSSMSEMAAIMEDLGGWPVLEGGNWSGDSWLAGDNWLEMAIKAWKKGFNFAGLISVDFAIAAEDATKRILQIDQPSLGLSREYLIEGKEDKSVKAYLKFMVDIAILFGAKDDAAKKEMEEVLDFEIKIAEISLPKEERRNETALYNMMTANAISDLYPLSWLQHLNKIVELGEKELVNVAVPKYLTSLAALLSSTPSRTVANYMMWRHVQFSVDFLPKKAQELQQQFVKVIQGQASKAPRWQRCVEKVAGTETGKVGDWAEKYYFYTAEGSLTNAVGAMYARTHFPVANKNLVDDIVTKIREEFRLILEEIDWMDEVTRERAIKKADLIRSHMAYDNEVLDNDLLEEFYRGLSLSKSSYLGNILLLKQWIFGYYAKEFPLPKDPHSWKTHSGAAIANAYYEAKENSMIFPAGILDGVFFQEDRPLYLNYGGIGIVVGHEITHGFDDQGSQRDAEGVLVDWWMPETKEHYLEKTQCVIDQFSNYTVEVQGETLHLNGINTQAENVADLGGSKEAIRAYNRIVERYGEEPRLPGLAYSPRQLFWVSGARLWCSLRRPEALKNQVLTDPHSPARFRINGPFSNQPEFSQDWGCPLGSPMNPVKKCQVW